ncbi:MAG: HAD family hydrolase [Candidatus Scalindua sp. AMX11]|nr:MAG: HAD family hydrolase [Candidatus Scalindua sp.]NOG84564.1 HAD family hydrolase [Planctomycetota bacterium]RZV92339.1 MAG: HAD family hydrolase [Candidatus Scalindua sp. SCAELEC01]TDE66137.1 MAG: HAD family hydrolase [Candidatus Scalindua sp. AMX11]GJQ59110.1 MAG: phosphoglycolate phosphatase [Candidatus Scalindua sp.]
MNNTPYNAVIFDLDGTLLNTLEDLANSMNRVLGQNGFPTHQTDAYRYFVGDGALELVNRALPIEKRIDSIATQCLEDFRTDYRENWKIKTAPYEGVPEMLDALKMRKVKMAILSNKPHEHTKRCVTELLPQWDFSIVLGQRNGIPRKPDPIGAFEVAEHMNIPPSEFIYLGDTDIDMKTSVTAGMFPVGALWGFRTAEELQESGAQALISHPLEILPLLVP